MADGLIAAVAQKAVADQDNTTVVAVRIEDAKASATDDATTRVVLRPKPEDADLRTRRIGVSRPVRGVDSGRKNTVLLATAAVLLISVAAVLIGWPLIRSLGGGQDAPPGASDTQAIERSKAAVDPPPEPRPAKVVPAPPPAKSGKGPSETSPQRPNRPANESEDSVRAGQTKGSGSPKTGSQPATEGKPGEGDGGSRPGSLPPSTEGEEGQTQRGGQPGAALSPPASSSCPGQSDRAPWSHPG